MSSGLNFTITQEECSGIFDGDSYGVTDELLAEIEKRIESIVSKQSAEIMETLRQIRIDSTPSKKSQGMVRIHEITLIVFFKLPIV